MWGLISNFEHLFTRKNISLQEKHIFVTIQSYLMYT